MTAEVGHKDLRDADAGYAKALTGGNAAGLEALLAPDFVLVDVLSGARVGRADLIPLIASGALRFDGLETAVEQILDLGDTAVVIGLSSMRGAYGDQAFAARSCYAHTFVKTGRGWRMALAQGTKLADR